MPCFEEVAIIVATDLAVGSGWDHRGFADRGEWREDAFIGIERLVGDQRVSLHGRQKMIGADEIMRLTASQEKPTGLPSASTMAWILVLNPPRDWLAKAVAGRPGPSCGRRGNAGSEV